MKFIKVNKHEAWGCQTVIIPIKEIRAVEYFRGPGYITIYYLEKTVAGEVKSDFDFMELEIRIRNNEYYQVNIYDELPQGEEEEVDAGQD